MIVNKVQLAFSTEAVTASCVCMTTPQTGDEDQAVRDEILENSGEESTESSQNEAVEEMDRLSLPPPPLFNIEASDLYSEWTHWLSSFDIYAVASDLQKKSNAVLGPTVQRIFSTLPGENTTFEATKEALNNYFAPKRNVVAERYKFRSRVQQPEEPIASQHSVNWPSPAISPPWMKR